MIWPARENIRYTPLFCEENIWLLARYLIDDGLAAERLSVLVLSNPWQSIHMAAQRAGQECGQLIWDYHVVLRAERDGVAWVLDPDSQLPFPVLYQQYLGLSFPVQSELPEVMRTWVRHIPAADFLRHFHSDREHMLDYIPAAAFPDYPIITPAPGVPRITLAEYCDMQRELADGSSVLTVEELHAASATHWPDHA